MSKNYKKWLNIWPENCVWQVEGQIEVITTRKSGDSVRHSQRVQTEREIHTPIPFYEYTVFVTFLQQSRMVNWKENWKKRKKLDAPAIFILAVNTNEFFSWLKSMSY